MNLYEQGSQEWLNIRKTHVTSTDIAAICGISPWKTAYSLWREKMGLSEKEIENPAMKRGTQLEPIAREWIETNQGFTCKPAVVFSKEHPFMMASLDGISECGTFVVEIKCGEKSYDLASRGTIPDYYLYQMMSQMLCANVQYGFYVSFNGETGIIIKVERNQKLIDKIICKAKEFYECMISFTPPELINKDYVLREDNTWTELSKRYSQIYDLRKRLQIQEEELKALLVSSAGSQNSMGGGIKLSKIVRKGNLDYDAILKQYEVDSEKYRKPHTEYWKIQVKND